MAKRYTMTFETGNAAFDGDDGPYEVAAILRNVAAKIEVGAVSGVIFDSNGNKVGSFEYPRDDD